MMKVFVTGGAGFIGSHLVDALINRNCIVTIYDNFSSGKKEFIEHHLVNKNNFDIIVGDVLNFEKLLNSMDKDIDVVFHLSANPEARWGIENTRLDLEQETIATYNVLEAMRRNDCKKIVFSSSGTVYGDISFPVAENFGPLLPISLYGAGKLASEGLITAFCHTFNMKSWIFRFSNIIGERGTHGAIIDFIKKLKKNLNELEILGNGNQEKPYLYVKDCVNGILYGFDNSNEEVNLFNLGCETTTKVKEIAEILVEEMNLKNVKFIFTGGNRGWKGDVPKSLFNIDKMRRLGWKTTYSSNEAVRIAIKNIIEYDLDRI